MKRIPLQPLSAYKQKVFSLINIYSLIHFNPIFPPTLVLLTIQNHKGSLFQLVHYLSREEITLKT